MDKKNFENLLQRYIDGNCTTAEKERIQEWFCQIENNYASDLTDYEKILIQQRLFRKIEDRLTNPDETGATRIHYKSSTRRIYYYAVAAAVIVVASFVYFYSNKTATMMESVVFTSKNDHNKRISHKNETAADQLINLHDNSKIKLAPGSSVSYFEHFEQARREVLLEGDAFFEVTKNPARPFIVYCGGTITKVLGTSFWIRTLEGSKSIEVSVKTGKVAVSEAVYKKTGDITAEPANNSAVLLMPNQRVIFFGVKKKVETTLVETPLLIDSLSVNPETFTYNDAPLSEVIEDLRKGYGIDIVTATENLKNCTFTGNLSDMNFDEKFEIVCASIGTKYRKQGLQVILTGEGCK